MTTLKTLTRQLPHLDAERRSTLADRLWDLAVAGSDTETLTAIAQTNHNDTTLHEKIATSKHPSVVSAWLANSSAPDRLIQAKLASERRAGVVASAISQSRGSRNELLCETARERLRTKATIALAEALITLDGLDTDTLLLVTTTLASSSKHLTERRESALKANLRQLAGDHGQHLAEACKRWQYIQYIAAGQPRLNLETFDTCIGRLLDGYEQDSAHFNTWARSQSVNQIVETVAALLRSCGNTPEQHIVIEKHTGELAEGDLQTRLTQLISGIRAQETPLDVDADVDTLREQAELGNIAALAALCAHRDTIAAGQQPFELTKLANYNLPLAASIAMDSPSRDQFTREQAAQLQDNNLLETLLGDSDNERAERAGRLIRELFDQSEQYAGRYYYYQSASREVSALLAYCRNDTLNQIKWPHIDALLSSYYNRDTDTRSRIVSHLLERLPTGDHWATFNTLSGQWTSTFGDLLDAVDAIAQEHPTAT